MRPEELEPEVNRLYWETDEPVTRLAEQLGISRGTFYNHLQPLRAAGRCGSCGGGLTFRTRSDRDNGAAQCASCGHEQEAKVAAKRAPTGARARDSRTLHVERAASETPVAARHTHEAALLSQRASWMESPEDEDRLRTQLIFVAVGAAILGLGILFYSRRHS